MIAPIKQPTNPIVFGYSSRLKNEWRKGNLPTVVKDVYGDDLVNPTLEHLIPKSKGGKTGLCNFGLANEATNNLRGNKPLLEFTTKENIENWFKQFIGVKTAKLDGDEYIKIATQYLKKNGINLDIKV